MATHRARWATLLVIGLGLPLVDCSKMTQSGGTGASTTGGTTVTATIGAQGGTLMLGGLTLVVPPNDVVGPTTFQVTQTSDPVPAGYVGYSPVYSFQPAGILFSTPLTLVMPYVGDETRAKLYWSDATGPGYGALTGLVSASTVTAQVSHFSTGFVGSPDSSGAGGAGTGGASASSSSGAGGGGGGGASASTASSSSGTGGGAPSCSTSSGGTCTGVDLMTDPMNCGACGHDCQGGACSAGLCQPVTFSTIAQGPVATDDAYVYWGASDGTVDLCPVSGCVGSPTIIASGQPSVASIAIDASAVYWVSGNLMTCPLTGYTGAPTTLVTSISGGTMASDGTSVYYTAAAGVMKVSVGGGTPIVLASPVGLSGGVAGVDATSVYFVAACVLPGVCELEKVNKDGTGLTVLDQGVAQGQGIAFDAAHVYFTSQGTFNGCVNTGCLTSVNKDGSGAVGIGATSDILPLAASNGCNVFWTTYYGNAGTQLYESAPVPGTAGTQIWEMQKPQQSAQGLVEGIAANSTSVFFTVFDDIIGGTGTSLVKLAK